VSVTTAAAHRTMDSPIGTLTLVATDGVLSGLHMGEMTRQQAPDIGPRIDHGLEGVIEQLDEYFNGALTEFTVPLHLDGDAFQLRVWQALQTIPYGKTWSYAQLAAAVGEPANPRTVGWANGQNPIAIIVPCHRVIGSDGSLTGYAGGLARKRYLLDLEAPAGPESGRLF
jgi:methylated-DNA-[protein]-cysteine S-methyltransferase